MVSLQLNDIQRFSILSHEVHEKPLRSAVSGLTGVAMYCAAVCTRLLLSAELDNVYMRELQPKYTISI